MIGPLETVDHYLKKLLIGERNINVKIAAKYK